LNFSYFIIYLPKFLFHDYQMNGASNDLTPLSIDNDKNSIHSNYNYLIIINSTQSSNDIIKPLITMWKSKNPYRTTCERN